jgi:uncharacterized protein (DUF302 family)
MSEAIWWYVRVYDPKSETYTHLSRFAETVEEVQAEIEDEGYWIFVSAEPEE